MNTAPLTTRALSRRTLAAGRVLIVRFAVVGALSILGAVVFVRELGTAAWATYSVAYFVTVLVDQTVGARLLGAIVRSDGAPSESLLRTSVTVMHVLGAVVLVLSVVGGVLLDAHSELPDSTLMLAAAGICSYVYAARSLATALLERELRFRPIVAAEIVDQTVFYSISIPWVLSGGGLEGVALALTVRGVIPALIVLRHRRIPRPGLINLAELRPVLAFLAPTLAATALAACEVLVPTIALGGSPTQLAFFLTGGSVVSYAAVLAFVAQRTSFPSLELARRTRTDLRALVRGASDLNALVLTAMVVPFCAASWWWYPALLGSVWSEAADVLVLMSAGFILGGASQVVLGALYSLGAADAVLRVNASAAGVFTIAVVTLVGPFPHLAAPLALTLGRGFAFLASYRAAGRRGFPLGFPSVVPLVTVTVGAGWIHVAAAQRDDTPVAIVSAIAVLAALAAATAAMRPLISSALGALQASKSSDATEVVDTISQSR